MQNVSTHTQSNVLVIVLTSKNKCYDSTSHTSELFLLIYKVELQPKWFNVQITYNHFRTTSQ